MRTGAITEGVQTPGVVPPGPKPRLGARRHQRPGLRLARGSGDQAAVPVLAWALPQGLRTGEEDKKQRVDTPGKDLEQPDPALVQRPSESPSIRRRPSSRARATSTFRSNVAAAAAATPCRPTLPGATFLPAHPDARPATALPGPAVGWGAGYGSAGWARSAVIAPARM